MHNQIIASTGMDHESHLAHDNNIYGNDSWGVDMNSYHHHPTTMPEYGSNYGYIPPITHGLPSEALSRMGPPPHPQSIHQPQASHTQLPMLMMPHQTTTTWPSQLVPNGPTSYSPHHAHPAPPVPIPSAPHKTKLPALQTSQPRKTLTDEDRRKMCQYAEDNPNAKQTDIGAKFGVERSTVSKVLRQKDKYLNQDDRSNSPIKRGKGKGVDIEKALTSWVRNNRQKGIPVTSEDVKERARKFSSVTVGGSGDSFLRGNSSSAWLEKFMQKNGIPGRLMRRASETNINDSLRRGSPSLSVSQPSSAISPASPSGHLSPSPLSANKSDEEKENAGSYMDFNSDNAYKHTNSQSTTSLPSSYADTPTTSYPGSALSPTASFNFSPNSNLGSFPPIDNQGSGFQRPRSQTFPTLDLEYINQSQNSEPMTPKYHVPSTAPSSALEPPSSEMGGPHYGLEHVISPQLRRTSSNGSIAGRSTTPLTASAVGSSPSSPTQEDARKAADTLLSFIQTNNFGDHHEILTILKLTEKLRLHQAQLAKVASHGMGGLSRIPEGDSEMPNAPTAEIKLEPTTRA